MTHINFLKGELDFLNSASKKSLLLKLKELSIEMDPAEPNNAVNQLNFLKNIISSHTSTYLGIYEDLLREKSLKYSALFKVLSFPNDSIYDDFQNISADFTISEDNDSITPWQLSETQLSFNFTMSGISYIAGETRNVNTMYQLIVSVLDINNELFLQIDSDNLPVAFRREQDTFFYDKIQLIKGYLTDHFNWVLEGLDLTILLENYRAENTTPKLAAQKMILNTGGQATLDSAVSENIILPIIGDLKALLENNQELVDRSPELKELLLDFIKDTEEDADIPWSTFIWERQPRSLSVQVKFFLAGPADYTLLSYYAHNNGRGGMNYVTRNILERYLDN